MLKKIEYKVDDLVIVTKLKQNLEDSSGILIYKIGDICELTNVSDKKTPWLVNLRNRQQFSNENFIGWDSIVPANGKLVNILYKEARNDENK